MYNIYDNQSLICMARNKFYNNIINDDIVEGLHMVKRSIGDITVDFTRDIVSFSLEKFFQEIDEKNIEGAGFILNFIHNLPFFPEEEKEWDFEYFLDIELGSFLERAKLIPSAREIALFACHKIYLRKFGS